MKLYQDAETWLGKNTRHKNPTWNQALNDLAAIYEIEAKPTKAKRNLQEAD